MESLIFLLLIFGMGYFMIVRPQQKRQRERADLLGRLSVGDDIVTIGGLHGRVEELTESTVDLVIAEDATGDPVLLRFDRQAIARVVPTAALDDDLLLDDDDVLDDDLDVPITDDLDTTVDVTDADASADRD